MFGVLLPKIIWVIVGCFAVYAHGNRLRDSTGVFKAAVLVLAWLSGAQKWVVFTDKSTRK